MSDHLVNLGPLGFTSRVRRLADRLTGSGRRLYEALDVPLESNWHALLLYLERHGHVSVTEAAAALKVSHPSVIDMVRRLEAAGLITASPDPDDGRRRVLALSGEGVQQLPRFARLWAVMAEVLDEMIEATAGSDALGALFAMEAQLDGEELDVRVLHRLEHRGREAAREHPPARVVDVRPATEADRTAIVHIALELVRTPDTYAYDPGVSSDELWRYWCPRGLGRGFVATLDGQVVGIFVIRPNIPGPGSHVANASYAVRADVRGMGVGRQMGEASLGLAAELGYTAMQFNTVVSTNANALRLWRSLGFRIVGTIPEGFRLPDGRYVSHHVMYRVLP